MRYLCSLLLILSLSSLSAQEIIWRSSHHIAAGYISSLPAIGDVATNNPSVHKYDYGLSASINYSLPYQMEAFKQQFANAIYGGDWGYAGLSAGVNGDNNSSLQKVGLQYSRKFAKNWHAGLAYYYMNHHFATKQNFSTSFSVAGLSFKSPQGWVASIMVQNMEQQTMEYPNHTDIIPSVITTAIQWEATAGLYLMAEIEKDFDFKPDFKGAIIYSPTSQLILSVGAKGPELALTAGAGFIYHGVNLHVGMAHHSELGLTTAASLSVIGLFSKSKKQAE